MAIEITKQGRTTDKWKVEVACERCCCEFKCDNTDFRRGAIKCPNCGNTIRYGDIVTAKNTSRGYTFAQRRIDTLTDLAVDEIDFEAIHKYMAWTKWKWAMSKSSDGVPTIDEMQAQVRSLINDAITERSTVGTGGFTVQYREYEEDGEYPATIGVAVSFNCDMVAVDINKDTLEAVCFDG